MHYSNSHEERNHDTRPVKSASDHIHHSNFMKVFLIISSLTDVRPAPAYE